MQFSYFRSAFALSAFASALGMTACGQLLDLDAYSKADSASGGSGGTGSGGEAGKGGSTLECMPNSTADCYEGPANTEGVGLCKAGLKTCNADGTAYGACSGQIIPTIENCAVDDDEDCNGASAGCTGIAHWSKAYGSADNLQFGSHVRAQSDGSLIITGEFSGMVDFGCKTLSAGSGSTDIFLLKLDSSGTCVYVEQFGVPQYNDYPYGLAVDADDNILLTGGYTRTGIDFGGGSFAWNGSNDMFLAKFDKDCKHIWSKRYGDSGDQLAESVNADAEGNIYVTGDFTGILDFGDGKTAVAMMNEKKGFLAKLDPNGNPIYVDSFGVIVNVTEGVLDTKAAIDGNGNATVVGRFSGSLNSGAGMVTSQPGGYDTFLLRYDNTGKPISVKRMGGQADDYNYYVAVDFQGNVYIAGRTGGTKFDLSQFGQANLAIAGKGDIVLMKLLVDGQLEQAKLFGDLEEQAVTGLAVDAVGHVILGGNFLGAVDFGNGSLGTAMKTTMYLAKFDASLKQLWARPFYSSAAETSIRVGTDARAEILLTGNFYGALQIKANDPLPNAGNADIFVAKLAP